MIVAIARMAAVLSATGYARSTLYLRISQGLWPRPVHLGPRCIGWPESEVEALINARIAGLSDLEIRKLVVELEKRRGLANPLARKFNSPSKRTVGSNEIQLGLGLETSRGAPGPDSYNGSLES